MNNKVGIEVAGVNQTGPAQKGLQDVRAEVDALGAKTEEVARKTTSATGQMQSDWMKMFTAFTAGDLMSKAIEKTIEQLMKLKEYVAESARYAARVETLGVAMHAVGNNAGYSAAQMDVYEQQVKKMGITTEAARQSLTQTASAQMDVAKTAQLARVAQDAAVIGNINSSEALTRMVQGIRSGEVEILKTIGINVSFENSYRKLADSIGVKTSALTESQKVQARQNEVLEYGINISGVYEASMTSTGKKVTSLSRYYDELKLAFGEAFAPALGVLIDNTTDKLKGLLSWFHENRSAIAEFATNMAKIVNASLNAVVHPIDTLGKVLIAPFVGGEDDIATANEQAAVKKRYDEMMAKKAEDERIRKMTAARQIAERAEADRKAAESAKKVKDTGLQNEKEMLRAMETARADYNRSITKAAEETEREQLAALKEARKEYYDYQAQLYELELQDQEKVKKAELDAIAAAKKAREDYYNWQKLHDPMTGAMVALQEYSEYASQIGRETADLVGNFFYDLEEALVQFVRHGKLSFTDLVDTMLDQMARIAVQQSITGPLSSWMSSMMGGGGGGFNPLSGIMGLFGSGAASGAGSYGVLAADAGYAGFAESLGASLGTSVQAGATAGAQAGVTAGLSTAAPVMAAALGIYAAGSSMYSVFGGDNSRWGNMSTSQRVTYGAAMTNPIGWGMIALDGMGVDVFGGKQKLDAQGLQLGVNNGVIGGSQYSITHTSGGAFHNAKHKTRYSDLDDKFQASLNSQYSQTMETIRTMSATLGFDISEAALTGFSSATTRIDMKGLDAEGQQKALANYYRQISNEAIKLLVPDIDTMTRLGEDAVAAYERMNALKLTNNQLLMQELELLGQKGGAAYMELLNVQRNNELLGMDSSTQAIKRRIWALQDEQEQLSRLGTVFFDTVQNAANALRGIMTGPLSTLSPQELLMQQQATFATALAAGDAAALPQLGISLLNAAREMYGSGSGYTEQYNNVTAVLAQQAGISGPLSLDSIDRQIRAINGTQAAIENGTIRMVASLDELKAEIAALRKQTEANTAAVVSSGETVADAVTGTFAAVARA